MAFHPANPLANYDEKAMAQWAATNNTTRAPQQPTGASGNLQTQPRTSKTGQAQPPGMTSTTQQPQQPPPSAQSVYGPSATPWAGQQQPQQQPTGWGNTSVNPALESTWQQYGNAYAQPRASDQVYGNASSQLQGQGYGQQFYQQNQGALQGPSASSQVLNSGGFSGPSAIGNLAASNPYGGQMQSSGLGAMAQQMLGGPTASGGANDFAQQQARMPTELSAQGQRIDEGYSGANYSQNFAQQNQGTLQGPGQLEQFAASSLAGGNPYAAMLRQEGQDAINQQLAARGVYGSGGGLAALAKYGANFDAQQFAQQADLQARAQDATMSRLGLGAGVAGQASGERMNQFSALQGLANDQFGQRMGAANLSVGAATQADSANVARLAGIANATLGADSVELGRLGGQANLANMASQNDVARLNAQIQAAGQADTHDIGRFNAMSGAAGQADASQLNRLGLMGGLANQADSMGLNYLNSMFNVAGATQQGQGDRLQGMLDNEYRYGALNAGLYGGFYGQGGQLSGDAFNTGIQAQGNAAQLDAQGGMAEANLVPNLVKTYIAARGGGAK